MATTTMRRHDETSPNAGQASGWLVLSAVRGGRRGPVEREDRRA